MRVCKCISKGILMALIRIIIEFYSSRYIYIPFMFLVMSSQQITVTDR